MRKLLLGDWLGIGWLVVNSCFDLHHLGLSWVLFSTFLFFLPSPTFLNNLLLFVFNSLGFLSQLSTLELSHFHPSDSLLHPTREGVSKWLSCQLGLNHDTMRLHKHDLKKILMKGSKHCSPREAGLHIWSLLCVTMWVTLSSQSSSGWLWLLRLNIPPARTWLFRQCVPARGVPGEYTPTQVAVWCLSSGFWLTHYKMQNKVWSMTTALGRLCRLSARILSFFQCLHRQFGYSGNSYGCYCGCTCSTS